jgi:molybdopterin/thiamine biosynthesis adenylyltransferase
MHQANIRAIGLESVQTLGKQQVSISDTSAYSQMLIFGGLGMGIGTIDWHIPAQPKQGLCLPNPTIDTIVSFIQRYDIHSLIRPTSEPVIQKTADTHNSATATHAQSHISTQSHIAQEKMSEHSPLFEAEYGVESQKKTVICRDTGLTTFAQQTPDFWVEAVGACLNLELSRKHWIRYTPYERIAEQAHFSQTVFGTDVANISKPDRKKVTVIGAGGIGMYVGLLYDAPCDMTIIDPDICEQTNLNRQLLYTKQIGRSKVEVLCETLQELYPHNTYTAVCEKVTTPQQLEKTHPDILISATDNLESRLLVSTVSQEKNIRHVDGGCSLYTASVYEYVPTLTEPIHIQRSIAKQLELDRIEQAKKALQKSDEKSQSCAMKINPSLFIPNALCAALVVGCAYDKKTAQQKTVVLDSPIHYSSTECSLYKAL